MRDRLDNLLSELSQIQPVQALEGFENRLFPEIRRRAARQRQMRDDLRRTVEIAAIALIVGLGAGLRHTVKSPWATAPQPQKISLLLTEIPAASLIE